VNLFKLKKNLFKVFHLGVKFSVIFLHLTIGETCYRQGDLFQNRFPGSTNAHRIQVAVIWRRAQHTATPPIVGKLSSTNS
jgi:hypothetical protein